MSNIVFVLIFVLVSLGCSTSATSTGSVNPTPQIKTSPNNAADPEEFAVYDLVINARCIRENGKPVVIQQETSFSRRAGDSLAEQLKYVREKLPLIEQSVLDDFFVKNDGSHMLTDNFNLSVKHLIAGNDVLEPLQQEPDFWGGFYKKFPGAQGMVSLSRVGFNREFTLALVYVATASGSDAGAGYYVSLSKREGRWNIVGHLKVWSV